MADIQELLKKIVNPGRKDPFRQGLQPRSDAPPIGPSVGIGKPDVGIAGGGGFSGTVTSSEGLFTIDLNIL